MMTPIPTPIGVAAEKISAVNKYCVLVTFANIMVDPKVTPARPLCDMMARKTPSSVAPCMYVDEHQ